jgi:hypothetical protein
MFGRAGRGASVAARKPAWSAAFPMRADQKIAMLRSFVNMGK